MSVQANEDSDISSLPPEPDLSRGVLDEMESGPRTGSIRSGSDAEDTIGDEFQFMNPPEPEQDSLLPAIILMGKRRSGKTSIMNVVFYKTPPRDTMYLEMTERIDIAICNESFFRFKLFDCPGQIDFFRAPEEFGLTEKMRDAGAVIFVIDSQEEQVEALAQLSAVMQFGWSVNRALRFEVFIHKVDCLQDDQKLEVQREIHRRVLDQCLQSFEPDRIAQLNNLISFYLTSIYDHSIFEAFSKVVQKLLLELPALEQLLDIFTRRSLVDKAFLFDMASKIYAACDSGGVDMQHYEICCDMIDTLLDISTLYAASAAPSNPSPPELGAGAGSVTSAGGGGDPITDVNAHAVIRLDRRSQNESPQVLYLRKINPYLALSLVMPDEAYKNLSLLDYNFMCLRKAIEDVFEQSRENRRTLRERLEEASGDGRAEGEGGVTASQQQIIGQLASSLAGGRAAGPLAQVLNGVHAPSPSASSSATPTRSSGASLNRLATVSNPAALRAGPR